MTSSTSLKTWWLEASREQRVWLLKEYLKAQARSRAEDATIARLAKLLRRIYMRWLPYLLRVVKQDEAEEEWEREFSQGMAEFLAQAQIEMRRMRVPERYLEAGIRATMHTVPGIGETAKKEARRILREVVESTPPDQFTFARRLRERWRHLSKRKSEEIAITEWRRMSATAHYLEAKDAGWEGKIWLTVGDERVCPTCRMLMAVGPQRLTEPWPIGEQHPPAHSRCRCTLSYIWRL